MQYKATRHLVFTVLILSGVLLQLVLAPFAKAASLTVPADGKVTSPFGWRVDPINGSYRFHSGVDIGAPMNAPVYAPQAGTVIYTGPYGGYGNVVVLQHPNGLFTLYGHLSQAFVFAGQAIQPGEAIALVGSTGRSTGPHLHFEVYDPRQYLNPLQYLANLFSGRPPVALSQAPITFAKHTAEPVKKTQVAIKKQKRKPNWTVQLVQGSSIQTVNF